MIYEIVTFLIKSSDFVCIDSWLFQLHYRFTSSALLLLALVFTQLRMFGASIECVDPNFNVDVSRDALNSHCWTNNNHLKKITAGNVITFDAYYQYIAMIFLLAALGLYVPRQIWVWFECNTTATLSKELKSPVVSEDTEKTHVAALIDYLKRTKGQHRCLLVTYALCESANLLMDALLLVLMFQMDIEDVGSPSVANGFLRAILLGKRWRPSYKPFPSNITCEYFSPKNASEPARYAQCFLPVNAFLQPVFILLAYWLALLVALSIACLVTFRIPLLSRRGRWVYAFLRLRNFGTLPEVQPVEGTTTNRLDYNDWFLLRLLKKNLHHVNYCLVVDGYRRVLLERGEEAAADRERTAPPPPPLEVSKKLSALVLRCIIAWTGIMTGKGIGEAILEIVDERIRPPPDGVQELQPRMDVWLALVVVIVLWRLFELSMSSRDHVPVLRSAFIDFCAFGMSLWLGLQATLVDHLFDNHIFTLGALFVVIAVLLGRWAPTNYRSLMGSENWILFVGFVLVVTSVVLYLWIGGPVTQFGYYVGYRTVYAIDLSFQTLEPLLLQVTRTVVFVAEVSIFMVCLSMAAFVITDHS